MKPQKKEQPSRGSPGRPPKDPGLYEPLNVDPIALAQAVLRPPKPPEKKGAAP